MRSVNGDLTADKTGVSSWHGADQKCPKHLKKDLTMDKNGKAFGIKKSGIR